MYEARIIKGASMRKFILWPILSVKYPNTGNNRELIA